MPATTCTQATGRGRGTLTKRLAVRAMQGLAVVVYAAAGAAYSQMRVDREPEGRALLERLALAKAHADLVAQVYALPLKGELTVGAWAARDVTRDRALRLWLRSQPQSGAARCYGDDTCDADVRLDPAALAEQLGQLQKAHPSPTGEPIAAGELRRAAERWPILWGSGTASAKEAARTRKLPGWEDVTPEGIEAARRAAEADARHALLDRARTLPVTNARRLHEFLDSGEAVRAAVLRGLERAAEVKATLEPDQVAVAEARLRVIDLIRILIEAHQEHYHGELFHAADFRGMALLTPQDELTATGLATPPRRTILPPRYQPIELDAPAWVATSLSAVGQYEPDDRDDLSSEARGEAARIDGIDRLRQKIEALVIQKDVAVAAFLGYHEELKDDVILFLSAARLTGPVRTLEGGVVEVPVELPLRRLWWIVRRGMRAIEVDLPDDATSQPAEKAKP